MTPEILAPVGAPETLAAAIRCGADAVYIGAPGFNARSAADQFTAAALQEAVAYCHARGVRVYVAMNTLVREQEMDGALRMAEQVCAMGADAMIIQDMGLARCLHAAAPAMPLHASTQMACHTPAGVRELHGMGFCRVVLAREMSAAEIAACMNKGCELEVFVHGALCMCVSGQCYLSAMLGGRSGNRGRCAQPCRLPFAAENTTAALSLRDLCLREHSEEMCAMGVHSLKIEGRMKRPEYVAAAVSVYRAAVDGKRVDASLLDDLQSVFSRSGFTDGYFTGARTRELFGTRRKEDVASTAVLARLANLYHKEVPRVPVRIGLHAAENAPAAVTVTDESGHSVCVTGEQAVPAEHRALEETRAVGALEKMGGTPFYARETAYAFPAGYTLPLSAINAMRREALEKLLTERGRPHAVPFSSPASLFTRNAAVKAGLPRQVARLSSWEQAAGAATADAVCVPLSTPPDRLCAGWGVEIPRGMFGTEEAVRTALRCAAGAGVTWALCPHVGAISLAREAGLAPVGGFSLNLQNACALDAVAAQGVQAATLSMELSLRQMAFAEGHPLRTGLMVYGRQPLMLMRMNPAQGGVLTDRKGVRFPLACGDGYTELLNSAVLYLADKRESLPALDFWWLHFTEETPAEVAQVLESYREGGNPPPGFTRGMYNKGVL